MTAFLAVLDKLLGFLQTWYKKQQETKWQKEIDDLENSPADWFEQHFDGVSEKLRDNGQTPKTNSEDK